MADRELSIVVARHGNTFEKGDSPTRVGGRTDLPLTETGREQARRLGRAWRRQGWTPAACWCGPLRRTVETARLALAELGLAMAPQSDERFREIDYGEDENRPEELVRLRLGWNKLGVKGAAAEAAAAGVEILRAWDERAEVPDGWLADPAALSAMWRAFAEECQARFAAPASESAAVLVVTSNGVARFAPALLPGGLEEFRRRHPAGPKLSTGAYGVFLYARDGYWTCPAWNVPS